MAAISVAQRVAEEVGCILGEEVSIALLLYRANQLTKVRLDRWGTAFVLKHYLLRILRFYI